MEEKYYTPSIEEFRVGFEFEVNCILVSGKDNWIKSLFLDRQDVYKLDREDLEKHLENDLIRVKCLTREDIVDLGFQESPDEPEEWYWKFRGNDDIQLYVETSPERDEKFGMSISIYDNIGIFFQGFVRNISELELILKNMEVL